MKKFAVLPFLILIIFIVWMAVYIGIVHPWYMKWGAVSAEVSKPLPGDNLIPAPRHESLRVITINAPPEKVWPWLIQIGQDKAAFYSYDWLENLLGVGYRNGDKIVPEWQGLQQGGFIRSVPRNWLFGLGKEEKEGRSGWSIPLLEKNRVLYLKPWGAFVFEPLDGQQTRFFARSRAPQQSLLGKVFGILFFDTVHFVMEKRMIVEVKRLSEARAAEPIWLRAVAMAGFILLSLVVTGVFIIRKRRRFWILLPLAYSILIFFTSIDLASGLTAFLAAGLAVIGFLVFKKIWWAWYLALWVVCNAVLIFSYNAFIVFGWLFAVASFIIMAIIWTRKSASGK